MIKHVALAALLAMGTAMPAVALNETWDSIKEQIYPDHGMLNGNRIIAIDAPARTYEDSRTQLAAHIVAPDNGLITKVTVVLDENPMPVSAVFTLDNPRQSFFFDMTMRVNGPTPMHVLAEMSDGRVFVAETYVKTSGQGACSAPPGTDPELALLNLGKMDIHVSDALPPVAGGTLSSLTSRLSRMDVDVSHPSHSGMQMNQISLLFIPMRYVEKIEIDLDGAGYVEMTGSISLSENPRVGISVPRDTRSVGVTMTDTSGTVSKAEKSLAGF